MPTVSNMRRVAEIARNEAEARHQPLDRFEAIKSGVLQPHIETVRRAIAAGVRIGLGTDSTGSYREEIEVMVEAGMDGPRVIQAATLHGAEICRVPAGTIEPGHLGTVLLYDSDPRSNPARLTSPDVIVHRGVPIGDDFWKSWGLGS